MRKKRVDFFSTNKDQVEKNSIDDIADVNLNSLGASFNLL